MGAPFPVAFPDMHYADRFAKYRRVVLDITDASGPRPENVKPSLDTIVLGEASSPSALGTITCAYHS